MVNFDEYVNENKTSHDKNWAHISDDRYRILIIRGSGSGKTNLSNRKSNRKSTRH